MVRMVSMALQVSTPCCQQAEPHRLEQLCMSSSSSQEVSWTLVGSMRLSSTRMRVRAHDRPCAHPPHLLHQSLQPMQAQQPSRLWASL